MMNEILEILLEQNKLMDELVGIIDWRSTAPTSLLLYKEKREKFNEKLKKFISANNCVSGSLPVDEIIEQLGEKRNRYEIWHDGGEWIISRFQKDDCRTVIGWLTGNDR